MLAAVAVLVAACTPGASTADAAGEPSVRVTGGFLYAPPLPTEAAGYLVLDAAAADTLVQLTSPEAASVTVHRSAQGHGGMAMEPVDLLVLPVGRTALTPGGTHLMFQQLRRPLTAGDTISLDATFRRAGLLQVRLPVIDYTDPLPKVFQESPR